MLHRSHGKENVNSFLHSWNCKLGMNFWRKTLFLKPVNNSVYLLESWIKQHSFIAGEIGSGFSLCKQKRFGVNSIGYLLLSVPLNNIS